MKFPTTGWALSTGISEGKETTEPGENSPGSVERPLPIPASYGVATVGGAAGCITVALAALSAAW